MELSAAMIHCNFSAAAAGSLGIKASALFGKVQERGATFEDHDAIVFEERHLAKGLTREVRRPALVKGDGTNDVVQPASSHAQRSRMSRTKPRGLPSPPGTQS